MASVPLGGPQAAPRPDDSGTVKTFSNIIGACLSLMVLVLLIGWGAKTILRDASGVPVVEALEGPMRVAPENPGGMQAVDQGLSVNAVAANATEQTLVPDDLRLAPPPVQLSVDDTVASIIANDGADDVIVPERPVQPDAIVMASAQAPVINHDLQDTENTAQSVVVQPAPVAQSAAPVTGLNTSLRPQMRPVVTAAAASAGPNFDTPVSVGTRLAQLGAFNSRAIAQREWDRLSKRNADYVAGKTPVIQTITSNGKTLYRLRVIGFTDGADARRFCGAIRGNGDACFPVIMQ